MLNGNRKYLGLLAIPLALALAFAPMTESAETKGDGKAKETNNDPKNRRMTPAAEAALNAAAARQLAAYADRNKDALGLIAAAQVLKALGARELKPDPKAMPTGDSADKQGPDMSVAALLDRARKYAAGRADLIALADDVAKRAARGDVEGPGCYAAASVRANGRLMHQITFRGGELAVLHLQGDGDTDLDMVVRDQNGNSICVADGPYDRETCRWTPRWTGPYRIEVINLGNVHNVHRLCTN